jgi:cell division protein FtsB
MSVESLTYADLAGRLGTSREAARSLVRRLKLPRQTGNDGIARVNVDLAEIQHKPLHKRSQRSQNPIDFDALKAQIEQLQAEVTKLETEKSAIEAIAAGNRADFERERERSDKLMTNTMTLASVAMSARAKAVRLESELIARRSHFWMRLRTRRRAASSQQFRPNAPPRPEEPIMQLKSIPAAAGRVRTFAELAALIMFAALITVFVEYGIPFLIQ